MVESAFNAVVDDWDRQVERNAHFDGLRTECEAAAAQAERERQAADAARRKQEADAFRSDLRSRFLAQPGATEQEFEQMYPELLRDHRNW